MKMTRKNQSIVHLQAIKAALSALKPQIQQVINATSVEHEQIDHKTTEINKRFYDQLDEYNRAKAKIKELEMSTQHHDQKVERLNDQLEQLSMELADVKKQIHDKGRNMTDATPLVEMRAAIQRLKEENREFDILIGVLYHELTLARKGEGNYKQSEDAESDDGITS